MLSDIYFPFQHFLLTISVQEYAFFIVAPCARNQTILSAIYPWCIKEGRSRLYIDGMGSTLFQKAAPEM